MAKEKVYTEMDKSIVKALKSASEGLTIKELSEVLGVEVKPGHMSGAVRKGLVEVIGEREIERPGTRNVTVYKFISGEAFLKADGKPFNYTDNEKAVLEAAATIEGDFTLAELAVVMNREKLYSGHITSLLKKGNVAKTDSTRQVATVTRDSVNVYALGSNIPAELE